MTANERLLADANDVAVTVEHIVRAMVATIEAQEKHLAEQSARIKEDYLDMQRFEKNRDEWMLMDRQRDEQLESQNKRLAYLEANHVVASDSARSQQFNKIRDVLSVFYRSPLSMSSVHPVLRLAEELDPSLRVQSVQVLSDIARKAQP